MGRIRGRLVPLVDRLEKFQVKGGPEECWDWTGSLSRGYGQLMLRPGAMPGIEYTRPVTAHRVAYYVAYGDPGELFVDHSCHNSTDCHDGDQCPHRRCTNPKHLEALTSEQNKRRGNSLNAINARKTHCKRGHEFTPENTRVRPNGYRECMTCRLAAQRVRNAAKREGK